MAAVRTPSPIFSFMYYLGWLQLYNFWASSIYFFEWSRLISTSPRNATDYSSTDQSSGITKDNANNTQTKRNKKPRLLSKVLFPKSCFQGAYEKAMYCMDVLHPLTYLSISQRTKTVISLLSTNVWHDSISYNSTSLLYRDLSILLNQNGVGNGFSLLKMFLIGKIT